MKRGRCGDLRLALRVARLAVKLGHTPTWRELVEYLGLQSRTARRWSHSMREVIEERTRPHGPRVFAEIEEA